MNAKIRMLNDVIRLQILKKYVQLVFIVSGFTRVLRLAQVPNRRDCEELCLSEAAFPCRSADYNILTLACALSR